MGLSARLPTLHLAQSDPPMARLWPPAAHPKGLLAKPMAPVHDAGEG